MPTKEKDGVVLIITEDWCEVICEICGYYYVTRSWAFAEYMFDKHVNSKRHRKNLEMGKPK